MPRATELVEKKKKSTGLTNSSSHSMFCCGFFLKSIGFKPSRIKVCAEHHPPTKKIKNKSYYYSYYYYKCYPYFQSLLSIY